MTRQLNLAFFGVGQTYDTGPLLHSINKPGITRTACTPTRRWP